MSNQKPNTCYEFEHTIQSQQKDHGHPGRTASATPATPATTRQMVTSTGPSARRSCANSATSYRKNDGSYDCLVPGSGGKDSFYAAHLLKYKYGMHPLTVTWAPHIYTPWGWENIAGLDPCRL